MVKRSVCFVGDELMLGLRDPDGFGWPQRLTRAERAHGHALVPYVLGIEGDTTLDVAARWRSETEARLSALPSAALVFCFGTNDTASGIDGVRVSLPDSLYAAEEMLSAAAAWRASFWIGPPPVRNVSLPHPGRYGQTVEYDAVRARGLSQAFAAIAARCGVPYLDLCGVFETGGAYGAALAKGNGMLPDGEGQALVSGVVGAWQPWRDWLDKGTAPNLYFAQ